MRTPMTLTQRQIDAITDINVAKSYLRSIKRIRRRLIYTENSVTRDDLEMLLTVIDVVSASLNTRARLLLGKDM
jgi:hypothetical protein